MVACCNVTIVSTHMDKSKNGFTLIELIVVIFIITLFAGMSLANYGRFNEEKKLDEEVKKLSATLYLARSKASAADADPAICSDFKGYRVSIDSSSSSYILERECANSFTTIETQNLPTSTTIKAVPTSVFFKSLNAGTDLTSQAKITVKNSVLLKCADVTVQPSGVINEEAKYTVGC